MNRSVPAALALGLLACSSSTESEPQFDVLCQVGPNSVETVAIGLTLDAARSSAEQLENQQEYSDCWFNGDLGDWGVFCRLTGTEDGVLIAGGLTRDLAWEEQARAMSLAKYSFCGVISPGSFVETRGGGAASARVCAPALPPPG